VGATAKQQQTQPKIDDKNVQLIRGSFGKEILLEK
jgi:hypothetical protein